MDSYLGGLRALHGRLDPFYDWTPEDHRILWFLTYFAGERYEPSRTWPVEGEGDELYFCQWRSDWRPSDWLKRGRVPTQNEAVQAGVNEARHRYGPIRLERFNALVSETLERTV